MGAGTSGFCGSWWSSLAACLAVVATAGGAGAADFPPASGGPAPSGSDWTVTLGAEGRFEPVFQGASRDIVRPYPIFDLRRAGTPERFHAPRDGISVGLIEWNNFQAGPVGQLRRERKESDDDALLGLGDIRAALELGAFAEYWWTPWLRTRGEVRQGFFGHHGVVADLFLDAVVPVTPQLVLSGGPRVTFATTAATSPYFSIDPIQSAASGLPGFDARGGLHSVGAGWWLLFPPGLRADLRGCVLLRFVREAANAMLPVAQIGGDVVGARLLTFRGVAAPLATASVIVDVMVQAATLFAFALLGLMLLFVVSGDGTIVRMTATGLAMAAPALGGFYVAQSRRGHKVLQLLLRRLPGNGPSRLMRALDSLYQSLTVIHAGRSSLLSSSLVHMVGWIIGVAEVYVALTFMGHPAPWTEALVIESLMHAVRGAAFAVPGALGAQEGALIVLCALFGIPPEHAVALSLAKRSADLALGIPGLLAWQWLEGRRLMRRNGVVPASAAPAPTACTDP